MKPARFRKKPVVIEALQFDGTNQAEVASWSGGAVSGDRAGTCIIETLEGRMLANVGDWIIKGVQGEFYPCRKDIFEQTYEPAWAGSHSS
jgi:hypothetical protein